MCDGVFASNSVLVSMVVLSGFGAGGFSSNGAFETVPYLLVNPCSALDAFESCSTSYHIRLLFSSIVLSRKKTVRLPSRLVLYHSVLYFVPTSIPEPPHRSNT